MCLNFQTKRVITQCLMKRFSEKIEYNSIDLDSLGKEQMYLAKKVILKDKFGTPVVLAGVDLSYKNTTCIVAYVALKFKTLEILERKAIKQKVVFPYIPTFLAFREGPPTLALLEKINTRPDVLMINGHGIAHPLFYGYASHIGVLTSIPTIGIATKLLYGMVCEIPANVGSYCYVSYKGRRVGAIFLSKKGCKPIIVSPGHLITIDSCLRIVKCSLKGYKLPEPLRLAHKLAQEEKMAI